MLPHVGTGVSNCLQNKVESFSPPMDMKKMQNNIYQWNKCMMKKIIDDIEPPVFLYYATTRLT